MIEYKYKKRENKFTENGHIMFEFDVLQRLKRLAYLEEQMKQGQSLPIGGVSKRLLAEMKKKAHIKDGYISSSVFSAFELACILNDHITMYRIRKSLGELKNHKLIDKKKFHVDNESNLMCWKWVITKKGFLNVC